MTSKIKTTAPVSSVGADGEQPNNKNYNEIIANENVKNNLQATNWGCREIDENFQVKRNTLLHLL